MCRWWSWLFGNKKEPWYTHTGTIMFKPNEYYGTCQRYYFKNGEVVRKDWFQYVHIQLPPWNDNLPFPNHIFAWFTDSWLPFFN